MNIDYFSKLLLRTIMINLKLITGIEEERFVEDEFKMRFRYFLSFKATLINKFYLSLYNELFINSKGERL